MTEKVLLVDLGASRSKSIVLDDGVLLVNSIFTSAGSAHSGDIIPMHSFILTLQGHLTEAFKNYGVISKILLATEMHGYLNQDPKLLPTSQYYSWRVAHSAETNVLESLSNSTFQNLTGLRPRSGLPVVHILASHQEQKNPHVNEIVFLPQAICRLMGRDNGNVHLSLAQSSGLYQLDGSPNYMRGLDNLILPQASRDDAIELGEIQFESHSIPVHGGYGDLQSSVYGVSPRSQQWIINLGTGSQVVIRSTSELSGFEKRSYLNNETLQAVTHLPAGRALNLFANLFAEIRGEKNPDYFWRELEDIAEFADTAIIPIDLNVFQQSRYFGTGGKIEGIKETSFSMKQLLTSLIYGIVKNYADIVQQSGLKSNLPILLSGKMGEKIALFPDIIEHMCKNKVVIPSSEVDSCLLGLQRIYIEKLST